jgi:hypothetical protein
MNANIVAQDTGKQPTWASGFREAEKIFSVFTPLPFVPSFEL